MLLNLIPYLFPTLNWVQLSRQISPNSYTQWAALPPSERTAKVYAIAERVLNDENRPGQLHYQRIQEMLRSLPSKIQPKTVKTWLRYRLRVIDADIEDRPAFTTGTDVEDGKYYMVLRSQQIPDSALPWVVTHELSHILYDDGLGLYLVKTVCSTALALFATLMFGWTPQVSIGSLLALNGGVRILHGQCTETVADNFAIAHCTKEQLREAILHLRTIQASRTLRRESESLATYLCRLSEDSRVAHIREALALPHPKSAIPRAS